MAWVALSLHYSMDACQANVGFLVPSQGALYDAEGRICAESSTPATGFTIRTGYIYDAEGVRVAKGPITTMSCDPTISSLQVANESDYILGPGGEQLTEMGPDGKGNMVWEHTNIYAAGQLMATYDPDGLHFHFSDWLGTRRAQTDYAGVSEQTCTNLPYGDSLACTGSVQAPTEHHFTGKERDSESGNDYFGARYYNSALGRFTTPDWSAKTDPVPYAVFTDPQSLNLYAYVRNNPLIDGDLDGHASPCGFWCEPNGVGQTEREKELNLTEAERNAREKAQQQGAQAQDAQPADNAQLAQNQVPPKPGSPVSAYPTGSSYCGDFVCGPDGKTHLGVAPAEMQGNRPDESLGDAMMFVPVEKLAAPLAGAAAKLGGDLVAKAAEAFFARGGKGLLNSNDFLRIGYGWQGSAKAGSDVFRIGIGSNRLSIHIHITLWKF